jgi:hypothetical protein
VEIKVRRGSLNNKCKIHIGRKYTKEKKQGVQEKETTNEGRKGKEQEQRGQEKICSTFFFSF